MATGILTYVAKNAGFQSVSDFLDKGTDDVAKVLQWKSLPVKPKTSVEAKEKSKSPPGMLALQVCTVVRLSFTIIINVTLG